MVKMPWDLPPGTLMRVTELYDGSTKHAHQNMLQGRVAWAITCNKGDNPKAPHLNTIWLDPADEFDIGVASPDRYTIDIPEDEVPDEVWAKLALLRLTGDAS